MQTDISMGLEVFATILIPLFVGVGSSCARAAKNGWHGLTFFIADAIVCCFVSVIVFWGLDWYPEIPPTVKVAICGLSSFLCGDILPVLRKRMVYEILNRWKIKEPAREETQQENDEKRGEDCNDERKYDDREREELKEFEEWKEERKREGERKE